MDTTHYTTKSVKDDQGQIKAFSVYEIKGSDGKAFRLVDADKKPSSSSYHSEGPNIRIGFFDALWIEDGEVFTLGFLTREKGILLGTLAE
jgi:hypothetical protein